MLLLNNSHSLSIGDIEHTQRTTKEKFKKLLCQVQMGELAPPQLNRKIHASTSYMPDFPPIDSIKLVKR